MRTLRAGRRPEPVYWLGTCWALTVAIVWFTTMFYVAGPAAAEPQRLALVIANSNYPDANLPLQSATKDADLLVGELSRDSFDIDLKKDLSRQDMQAAVDAFLNKIRTGTTALVYFNGIGIQVAHQTYLIPVNAEIWSEGDVKREGISIDNLLADMQRRGALVKIVIIDASRRNPFERRFRAYSGGLAGIDAPEGTLVMYAAAPNKVGKDSNGDVSLFMSELVKELRTPDISAEEAMTHTRVGVSRASNGEQVPWVASSLIEPFYFGRAPGGQGAVSPPPQTPSPKPPAPVAQVKPPALQKPVPKPPTTVAQAPQPKPPASKPPLPKPPETVAKPAVRTPVAEQPPVAPKPDAPKAEAAKPAVVDTRPGTTFRDCPTCPELIVVPAGVFDMGSGLTPFDKPSHRVTIAKPLAFGLTEVTFNSWEQCANEGGCKFHPDDQGFGKDERPVINVGWFDAKDYVAWLSKKTGKTYRLPSEAEWEYAAHGGTRTAFSWGAEVGGGKANCAGCGAATDKTMPVKSFPPNGFGLFDMAGNAAEWVEDCWNLTYRGAPRDGSAWLTGNCAQRALRGGSFDSPAAYIKPSARFRYDADVRYWANGFRVVREVP